jgi:hypothetical protein
MLDLGSVKMLNLGSRRASRTSPSNVRTGRYAHADLQLISKIARKVREQVVEAPRVLAIM